MRRRTFLLSASFGALGAATAGSRTERAQRSRWEPDGAATLARLGVLTPDFDPVPESELWAMAPRGVSIHGARMSRRAPGPRAFAEPPIADEAVDRLVPLAPRAILFAYTGSSYALGAEAERQMRSRLEERAKGVPVIFTCEAAAAALRLIGARRLSLVHPPWFSEATNEEGAAYWRAAGFEVLQSLRVQPARSFTEVPAAEVFEFVSAHTPAAADAVFIGGNGLRAVGTIRALEARLRRPVLSANQVLLWEALRAVGQTGSVTSYGRLFRNRGAAQ
jgi:maleate isomerase